MKRFSLMALMLCLVMAVANAGALIEFAGTSHDFGTIAQDGGRVSCEYEFTNTGDAPLVIVSVTNGGCGCTTPSFPKEPIKPGEKGVIKITFDPKGRMGELNRTVLVDSNGSKKRVKLHFSGVVVPGAR